MTGLQAFIILSFTIIISLFVIRVATGKLPFCGTKPYKYIPYTIAVNGYGKYKVYYAWEDEPSWYMELPETFNTLEEAEKHIVHHKDWLIKRKFKTIKKVY